LEVNEVSQTIDAQHHFPVAFFPMFFDEFGQVLDQDFTVLLKFKLLR